VARHRRELHQKAREIRAASKRSLTARSERQGRFALVLGRRLAATVAALDRSADRLRRGAASLDSSNNRAMERREETLARLRAALDAHDPQRTLERGYGLVLGPDGEPLAGTEAVREARVFDLRMADGTLPAEIRESMPAAASAPPVRSDPPQPTLLQDSDPA
jgi:exodeoxyribonuclease VII large subunit